jgi:signal transduction histidine kinase
LGLWIAQQIITAHGGSIQAQNGPAGGAVFVMTLPLNRESAPPA